MTELSATQIDFVSEEIKSRGVELENLHDDLLDHICTSIERKMDQGENFDSAFIQTIKLFGPNGLMQVQNQTLLLLTQMNETMKKVSFGFGLATTAFLLAGILFKVMHWPGAAMFIVVGNVLLICGYLPMLLIHKLKESPKNERFTVVAGFIGLAAFATGVSFKLMHWPMANILFWTGFIIIVLGYMPLYFYRRIKVSQNKTVTITSAMIAVIIVSLLLELTYMGNSRLYNHGITVINEQLENAATEPLAFLNESSEQALTVEEEVTAFIDYVEDLKIELQAQTQGLSKVEVAQMTLGDLSKNKNHKVATSMLFHQGIIKELQQKAIKLEQTLEGVLPAELSAELEGAIGFQFDKEFTAIGGEQQDWATYHYYNISLIGVISNLSYLQLQAKHGGELALMYIKSQSEAQQPPSAEF